MAEATKSNIDQALDTDETNVLQKFLNLETEVKDQRKRMISLQQKLKDQSQIEECLEILQQEKEEHCEKIELLAEFAQSLKCNWEKLASRNTKLKKRQDAKIKKIVKNFEHITLNDIQESHSKECDMYKKKIEELQESLKISQDKKNKWKEKAQQSDSTIKTLLTEKAQESEKMFPKLLTKKAEESDKKSQKLLTEKDASYKTLKISQITAESWKGIAKVNEVEYEKLITEKERLFEAYTISQNEIKEVTFEKSKLETALTNTQREFSTLILEKAELEKSLATLKKRMRKMESDRAQPWHGNLGDISHIKNWVYESTVGFFPSFEEARTRDFYLTCMLLLIIIFVSIVFLSR